VECVSVSGNVIDNDEAMANDNGEVRVNDISVAVRLGIGSENASNLVDGLESLDDHIDPLT
jgi:hypothetical protein